MATLKYLNPETGKYEKVGIPVVSVGEGGDASAQIAEHDANPEAHADIRDGAVKKSGDTMTGALRMMSSGAYSPAVRFYGSEDNYAEIELNSLLSQFGIFAHDVVEGGTDYTGLRLKTPSTADSGKELVLECRRGGETSQKVIATTDKVAPAGYGYGGESLPSIEAASGESDAVFAARFDSILAAMPNDSTKQAKGWAPAYRGCGNGLITIHKTNDNYAVVFGFAPYNKSCSGYWRMSKDGGVWTGVEYSDPPMELGKEYRTTERCEGKPVYAMRVAVGDAPVGTSGYSSFTTPATGVKSAIRSTSCSASGSVLPNVWGSMSTGVWGANVTAYVQSGVLCVAIGCTGGDSYNAKDIHTTIWYTKNND